MSYNRDPVVVRPGVYSSDALVKVSSGIVFRSVLFAVVVCQPISQYAYHPLPWMLSNPLVPRFIV